MFDLGSNTAVLRRKTMQKRPFTVMLRRFTVVRFDRPGNNALGATNRVIKDEDTLRERLVLSRFTVVVFSIVNKWSKKRNPTLINSKQFERQPLITLST
ncbi:unnamed protein product [Rotaria magnacalcarata]|uniref:Uncharacterized protein n=3 Tax=Rotaria magnacalcarata TaxID=392030 RepID=A0A820PUW8_9BILA|nr:unnamed protein product [Rotaria magnacalcarata]CAF2108990.1 unnamed protein product [Rotaria magnacalcarata]CAF4051814.1 unnamed protein product [Rotaria magnacalcarata]CAF4410300.1 unnamed protein product [Rotaria magnacalcarata]